MREREHLGALNKYYRSGLTQLSSSILRMRIYFIRHKRFVGHNFLTRYQYFAMKLDDIQSSTYHNCDRSKSQLETHSYDNSNPTVN